MVSTSQPAITVVVCSFNGSRKIARCLDALERQTARAVTQIVVVDDGSTDGTSAVAGAYDVELVRHETNRGLSAARNTGVERARAPIVAFTDDDCLPEPGWLGALIEAHERPEVVGAGGPVEAADRSGVVRRYLDRYPPLAPLELDLAVHRSLPGRFALYLRRMWLPPPQVTARAVYAFPGANMSFKKAALEAVGGFNPRLRFGSDDEYICDRIRGAHPSRLLWFAPAAVVRHAFEGTVRDVVRRNYAYGHGQALVYLDDPARRWPVVFPLPLVVAGAAATGVGWHRLVRAAVASALLYPQGPLSAARSRRLRDLAFSGLRLAEESAHNLGMLAGMLDHGLGKGDRRAHDAHR